MVRTASNIANVRTTQVAFRTMDLVFVNLEGVETIAAQSVHEITMAQTVWKNVCVRMVHCVTMLMAPVSVVLAGSGFIAMRNVLQDTTVKIAR